MTDRVPRPVPQPVEVPAPNSVLMVFTNAPDADTARRIARILVEERLAACVNLLGECRSVYEWKGEVEETAEVPMLIKTAQDRYAALQRRLLELHPYELPEILAIKPAIGLPAYADWVIAGTRRRRAT